MGYRSDVAILIVRDNATAPTIPQAIALAKVEGVIEDDFFAKHWDAGNYGWTDDRFMFSVKWVKWYNADPAVSGLCKLVEFFSELNVGSYSGKFVRCGDNLDDNIEEGFGANWDFDELSLIREVCVEDPHNILGNQKE